MAKRRKKKKNLSAATTAAAGKPPESVSDGSAENLSESEQLIRDARSMFAPIPHSDSFTEADFEKSVDEIKKESINEVSREAADTAAKPPKKKRSRLANIIELGIIGVCGVVALVCIVMLVINIRGKIRGAQIYDNTEFDRFTLDSSKTDSFNHPGALLLTSGDSPMLSLYDRIAAGATPKDETNGEYSEKLNAMKASLTALRAKNPDIFGWIYVENTGIDYPILKGIDNDYYLNHAYTGESLPIGSIFVDANCRDSLTENRNTVIYGHNVVTGAMFHDVTKFLDASFFAANKIYIYTMDGVFIYKPVSVYATTEKYFYYRINFSGDSDFASFAAEVISKSSVPSGESISPEDTMITLSTCTNGNEGGRYALHAKLCETIK